MAKWIKTDSEFGFLACSNCGWEFKKPNEGFDEQYPSWTPLDFNYCPMCGEKIEKCLCR